MLAISFPTVLIFAIFVATVSISATASFKSLATVITLAISVATVLIFAIFVATVFTFALLEAREAKLVIPPSVVILALSLGDNQTVFK